jgi:hypothetical protein
LCYDNINLLTNFECVINNSFLHCCVRCITNYLSIND